jgi:hypothetical protein
MNRAAFLAGTAFLTVATMVGCAPSVDGLARMREDTVKPEAARDQTVALLRYFGVGTPEETRNPPKETRQPVWRVEALRTMAHLDVRFAFYLAQPQIHESLRQVLLQEYRNPNVEGEEPERRQLRAWAVQCLGTIPDGIDAPLLASILDENTLDKDPGYIVTLAALNALVAQVDAAATDATVRRRLLWRLAGIATDLYANRLSDESAARLRPLARYCEARLKSYVAVVDLLPVQGRREITDPALLEILRWNAERLLAGDHRAADAATQAAFRDNVERLRSLMWDDCIVVRKQARLILAEFAPLPLLETLTGRFEGQEPCLDEDFVNLANVVSAMDRTGAGAAAAETYPLVRCRALTAAVSRVLQASIAAREVFYARLAEDNPAELAGFLLSLKDGAMAMTAEDMLQHVRYLGHVRRLCAAGDDGRAMVPRLTEAIGDFVRPSAIAVRQQVVALLLPADAVVLARKLAGVMKSIGDEQPGEAEYALDAYLSAIEQGEKQFAGRDARAELRGNLGEDPYAALAEPLARPEHAAKSKVTQFLLSRDMDLLAGLLCADLTGGRGATARVTQAEVAMLGDLVQGKQAALKKESVEAAVTALESMLSRDEDAALLACRYLLEMGRKVELRDGQSPAVRQLIQASGRPQG